MTSGEIDGGGGSTARIPDTNSADEKLARLVRIRDSVAMENDNRESKAQAARGRFEKVTAEIAAERRFANFAGMTEIEMLEYPCRLQTHAQRE